MEHKLYSKSCFDSTTNKFKKQLIFNKPESELYMSNIKSHTRIITLNKIHSITWTVSHCNALLLQNILCFNKKHFL